jgi:ferric-dicitrate binding protein FerR (iron transport regulator)
MSDDYLWDRSGPRDPEVERLEQLLRPLAHDAPLDELRLRRRRKAPWIVLGVALAAAAAVAVFIALPREPAAPCAGGRGFPFTGRGGSVSCGGAEVAAGVLPVGGSLDTGAHEADLAIAEIGSAQLGPHTRVHLDHSDVAGHHLTIDRGRMHARVNAPPRLFAVATRGTEVTDLGCEYTIEVDVTGAGSIVVQSGKVELAAGAHAIVVAPAGTHATIFAGQRPGVPVGAGASAALVAAVRDYEHGDPAGLSAVLAAAGTPDAITLVGLAAIDGAHRADILARLAAVSPPPGEVTVDAATRDPAALERWRDDVVAAYAGLWAPRGESPKQKGL